MAVCRFRPRRAASRRSVQPDRHRQDERHRSAGLAGRCPGPHRRTPCPRYRCFAAMELAAARGITQPGGLTSQPQTSNYPAVFTACFRNVQALMLFNIVDAEVTVGELTSRGCYLGSNVSYNVKKLVESG